MRLKKRIAYVTTVMWSNFCHWRHEMLKKWSSNFRKYLYVKTEA